MIKTIAFMPRRADTTRAEFRDYYETRHAPLAIPLFPFDRYRRNHLAEECVEPGFDCVSEFWITSLEKVGALMAGKVGDIMREDEQKFLDQPSIVAVLSTVALEDGDPGDTLLLLHDQGGSREALIGCCQESEISLEFLSQLDERPTPFDALVRVTGKSPQLPVGWKLGLEIRVELCETDHALLMGDQA